MFFRVGAGECAIIAVLLLIVVLIVVVSVRYGRG
jgi:hypothetical protein